MFKIIFTKKYREFNPFYVKHVFLNLQFYIDRVDPSDKEFFKLYQEYLDFLLAHNYPLHNHYEFTSKYEKYLPNFKERAIAENVPNAPVECSAHDVVIAILAKDKGFCLKYYLGCIYNQTYNKKRIHLYVRTNDNTDNTEEILEKFINDHKEEYASVYFDNSNVSTELKQYGNHEWNSHRFSVLGKIRQDSINYAINHNCHYFVIDCDNFIKPSTLQDMLVNSKSGVVGPLLKHSPQYIINKRSYGCPGERYSNYHESTDSNGYYKHSNRYDLILDSNIVGTNKVDVVHCTYFIHNTFLKDITYNDNTKRHEYVIFSENLRNRKINQYINNRKFYGFVSFAENITDFNIETEYWKDKMAK